MQKEEHDSEVKESLAREWPCASCAILLGVCHFVAALGLLVFDVATNATTSAKFPVSASLSIFICAMLSFIAARRIDKAAQILLLLFATLSTILCSILFIESSRQVNSDETVEKRSVVLNCQVEVNVCSERFVFFHVALICIALIEFVISLGTIIVCFRSLRRAYAVRIAKSPYSTLIVGDYNKLVVYPPAVKSPDTGSSRLSAVENLLRL
ncbi:hypothetical protein Ddc_09499 [Ditylenchus destructor]|nr:hypothetical protein Ddc_09499 [Ditylenchus destructor]